MELTLKKKEVVDLIERYYREKNIEAKVTLSARMEPVGLYEDMCCVGRVIVKKKIDILGVTTEEKEELTQDMVLGIMRDLLSNTKYEINSIVYDSGINNVSVGYGLGEHTENKSYFNGIKLYVRVKKDNILKRMEVHV